jgi:4-amino-4-deoxy-L-arabinose transferase-like glycosyltransferase
MVETISSSRREARPLVSGKTLFFIALALLVVAALALRLWALDKAPPWLWWDEATQGLDARDLLHGHFQIFFPRAEGKEPLYIYLTTPFVAAWDGQPLAVRLAGALTGVLMVPTLVIAGRALWRKRPALGAWAGLLAAAFWTVNFWPQSINRIGFQVNTMPLMVTLALIAWLNWTHRPTRRRALTFGVLAGLALWTYLAARVTPALWLALYLVLPRAARGRLRSSLLWAVAGFALAAGPLLIYFLLHPGEALNRVDTFANLYQAPAAGQQLNLLWHSAKDALGGFLGWAGDPIPRHNIPYRPPFSPVLAILFGLGLALALWSLLRRRPGSRGGSRGLTLLLWWGALWLPSVLGANSNPHFPRLLAALAPAFLLAAWPVAALAGWLGRWQGATARRWAPAAVGLAAALLIVVEGAGTVQAYFVTWAGQTDLYTWYQGDLWSLGQAAQAGKRIVAPVDDDSAGGLDYVFHAAPIQHVMVDEATIEPWLAVHLHDAAGSQVSVPLWNEEPYLYADPLDLVPYYLSREGTRVSEARYRGYTLQTYNLGPAPQFTAVGRGLTVNQPFSTTLTLTDARWGAAYPNPDRNGDTAAAGTAFWVILGWRTPAAGPRPSTLRVAVDLVDGAGHRLETSEKPLVDPRLPAVSGFERGLHTYHLVTVPPTQPPGPVTLEVRAYNPADLAPVRPPAGTARFSVPLTGASVGPALQPVAVESLHIAHPVTATLGSLSLLGLDTYPSSAAPGQAVTLRLYWRASTTLSAAQAFQVTVGDRLSDGSPSRSQPSDGTVVLPAGLAAGSVVHTYAEVRVPADLATGVYPLVLRDATGSPAVPLGHLQVAGRLRRFETPTLSQAAGVTFGDAGHGSLSLLGLAETPGTIQAVAGQPITFTLVWRANETPAGDLVRFVHLLGADGKPVAQLDTPPCGGQCPATSWLLDEVIVDPVQLALPGGLAPGSYPLAVGWYDREAAGAPRLPARDGAGAAVDGNLFVLPVKVVVSP